MHWLARKSVNGIKWNIASRALGQVVNLGVAIILTRLLQPNEFGQIAIANVFVTIAGVFSEMGLLSALVQRRDVSPLHYSSAFYCNVLIAGLLGTCVILSSGLIANAYGAHQLRSVIMTTSLLFLINALPLVQVAKLTRDLNFAKIGKARVAATLISGLIAIWLATSHCGIWALVGQANAYAITYAIAVSYRTHATPKMVFSFNALRELWSFGSGMFGAGLIDTVYRRLDFLIIGKALSLETLGFFQRAKSLESLVTEYTSTSLNSVLFPTFSLIRSAEAIRSAFLHIYYPLTWVVLGMTCVGYATAEGTVSVLFSAKWATSASYYKILLLGTSVYPLSGPLGALLQATGESRSYLKAEALKKSLFMANLLLLFCFSLKAYLYGLAVALAVAYVINLHFAAETISLRKGPILKHIALTALIAALCATIVAYLRPFMPFSTPLCQLCMSAIIAAAAYVGLSFLFRPIGFIAALGLIASRLHRGLNDRENQLTAGVSTDTTE